MNMDSSDNNHKWSSIWLWQYFVENENHTNQPGLKYHVALTGDLWTQVLNRMVHQAIAKLRIPGDVAQMTYHRVNQNSVSQVKDEFDMQHIHKSYITIIIPFTNLDVYIETETSTTKDATKFEIVLCYIKPFTSLLIQNGVEYRFQDNTAIVDKRWLDIKFIPLETEMDV